MNDLALYIASKPEVRTVLLVLGQNSDLSIVEKFASITNLDYLFVYIPSSETNSTISNILLTASMSHHKTTFKQVYKADLPSLRFSSVCSALAFDSMNPKDICLPQFNFSVIAGVLYDQISFELWSAYRSKVNSMYFLVHGKRDEVLRWERNEYSNIELSVVFPMYNVAPYLSQCIDTVTKWDSDYVEFLFVDDGSPDNCSDIVRKYARRDSRIKLLAKANGGCASARQYGLENSKGRYISFIDPDDFVDPTMLPKLFERAMIGSYDISYCGYNEYYNESGKVQPINDVLGHPYDCGTSSPEKINELIAYRRIAIWRGIYLKDFLVRNNIHFYTEIKRFDDLPFKVETFARAHSVVCVPEYLYYYRMSRPGQDVAADDERLFVHFEIFKKLDTFFKSSTDRRQLDYLQIVKIQTHHWALTKLRPEYIKSYCLQAHDDLKCNIGFWNSLYIIGTGATHADLVYYFALYFKMIHLISFLANRLRKT